MQFSRDVLSKLNIFLQSHGLPFDKTDDYPETSFYHKHIWHIHSQPFQSDESGDNHLFGQAIKVNKTSWVTGKVGRGPTAHEFSFRLLLDQLRLV